MKYRFYNNRESNLWIDFFSDFVVTFRYKPIEFPGFFIHKSLTYNYLVRLEGIEPS